jgi:hypothetical protein
VNWANFRMWRAAGCGESARRWPPPDRRVRATAHSRPGWPFRQRLRRTFRWPKFHHAPPPVTGPRGVVAFQPGCRLADCSALFVGVPMHLNHSPLWGNGVVGRGGDAGWRETPPRSPWVPAGIFIRCFGPRLPATGASSFSSGRKTMSHSGTG